MSAGKEQLGAGATRGKRPIHDILEGRGTRRAARHQQFRQCAAEQVCRAEEGCRRGGAEGDDATVVGDEDCAGGKRPASGPGAVRP
ncbi:hypothetical protein GMST_24070 [Geomonas silvestris]|uniref:Uncharacterized protein n=1 Tax=Geomonas silvestris TaxID=2740184 RepID=A0A6V8MJF1_9BACT|nr:hypothetical protein GMST_24070 [Geomonas silvestris]